MSRLQTAENIALILQHLGLEQAHIAARLDTDWTRFTAMHPDTIASLMLICPSVGIDAEALRAIGSKLLVIADDQPAGQKDRDVVSMLEGATLMTLPGYSNLPWSDVAVDRTTELEAAISEFTQRFPIQSASLPDGVGEVNGVSYNVEGSGPPLLLLPLSLAPSQWDPLLPTLRERFTTIRLGDAHMGYVPILECRAQTGYLHTVANVVDEMHINARDRLLEVGCGTGVLCRWLAQRSGRTCPIVGLDQNAYLLRVATELASQHELKDVLEFRQGDALALPFEDASFDATMSFTVLEEVDADRALSELVRVTKPGGRVGVVVRAVDRPWQVNANVSDALRDKVEAPFGAHSQGSCADVSLYQRAKQVGLTDLTLFPHMAALTGPVGYYYLDRLQAKLTVDERAQWQAAVAEAEAAGTLFIAQPFHCAVGTKPESGCSVLRPVKKN